MSKSLVRVIDYSLLPALLLVVGKFCGLIFVSFVFKINISFTEFAQNVFAQNPSVTPENLVMASTYSDLFMFVFIATYFSFILFTAIFFHDSHISPQTAIRLTQNNLLGLIKSSYEIYHSATIALVYLWIANVVILFNYTQAKTDLLVLLISFTTTIFLSTALYKDVHREIEAIKKNPARIDLS